LLKQSRMVRVIICRSILGVFKRGIVFESKSMQSGQSPLASDGINPCAPSKGRSPATRGNYPVSLHRPPHQRSSRDYSTRHFPGHYGKNRRQARYERQCAKPGSPVILLPADEIRRQCFFSIKDANLPRQALEHPSHVRTAYRCEFPGCALETDSSVRHSYR